MENVERKTHNLEMVNTSVSAVHRVFLLASVRQKPVRQRPVLLPHVTTLPFMPLLCYALLFSTVKQIIL